MERSEKIRTVEQLLRKYTVTKTYINNLYADIEDYEARLQLPAAPKVPSLSPTPRGSGKSLSQEEREYLKREEMTENVRKMQAELGKIEPMIKRLERSLEALTETDRRIIEARYINGYSWPMVARAAYSSEGYVRKRSKMVIELIADMILGPKEIMVQMLLTFF
ncbi:RNA polymerase subunit sigma-70 [Colibacter massiliensis]|uniref:RNA polymerase subunit sigma-70 n=1 Tax=Colibacter massiliensis TaxID=1852379 RepID=UPI003F90953C